MAKNDVEIRLIVKDELSRQYKRIQNEIQRANRTTSQSQKKLAQDSQEASRKLISGFTKAKQAANSFKKGITDAAKRFGPAAIAVGLITGAIVALGNAMDFVRTKTIEFEKTLSQVKAILQPTESQFRALSNEARRLGETTAFSASEAGEAFVELGKLGLTTNQILAASSDVLNLAAAAQLDLARAAELTAITIKQFGLQADDAQRITDVMSKSFTSSALDAEKFGEAMKLAGPPAAALGLSVETATGAIAELANAGISGSMAGTSLRRVMLELADSNSKAAKLIGKAKFETLSFTEKLQELQSKNLSPTTIKKTFGLLASTTAGILIKGADNVERFDKVFQAATGSAQAMADTMLDNVAGATKILESAQEGLGLAIGEAFGEAKRKRIEFYTRTINFATSFVNAHRDALKIVGDILSDTFLASINIVVTAWRGWIGLMELSIGALLKVGQGLVEAGIAVKKFGALLTGSVADVSDLERLSVSLGDEATLAFERAREAAQGFTLSKSIKQTKELTNDLGKLGSTVDTLAGLEDLPIDIGKEKKIPGAKTVDFQKAQQDAIEAQEKLAQIAQQTNQALQLELLSGKEKELEILRRFEAEKEELLAAGGENNVMLDQVIEQRRTAILMAETEKRKALINEGINVAISGASDLTSALGNLSAVRGSNAIKEAEAAGKSEEQIQALRKKTFEQQKKFQLAGAFINVARGITAGISKGLPFGPIEAALAATAGAIQIAAIKAQTFTHGGIVPGNNFSGDNVTARVNSGELILNRSQQKNLLSLANGRGGGGGGNQITFEAPVINIQGGDPSIAIDAVNQTYQENLNKAAELLRDSEIHELV